MSWKKHFRIVSPVTNPSHNALDTQRDPGQKGGRAGGTSSKYSSYLPEIYAGHPNRIQRYYQYEDMDRDSDINAALDTIADFCTQSEEQNDLPFEIHYHDEANETEVKLLKTYLDKWVKLNDFKSRLWYIFRGCIKNGDQFFLRDPETNEWLWIDHFNVEMVKVDESRGKDPDEYVVRGLDYNKQAKFATKQADPNEYRTPMGNVMGSNMAARPAVQGTMGQGQFQLPGSARDPRQQQQQNNEALVVDAEHVVHLSLSVGMDINWPFGSSILEPVFKTYKQKELLEDSIIIYRVQRAPERLVFYVDVGNMPAAKANAHLERLKTEFSQRRIPNRTGGGTSIMDAAYNPLCLALDTKIPLLDGRTLTLNELINEHESGKENWIYSCDPITGKLAPGNITWAGVTRRNADVVRLTLDNGETITCTPDHHFPVLGRGKVKAKDIRPNEDSLISYETRYRSIDRRKKKSECTYQQIYDHETNKWNYTHRVVGEFFRKKKKHQEFTFLPENVGKPKAVIHHMDYDRYNNDPRNLAYMNKEDHVYFHVLNKRNYWDNMPTAERNRLATKIGDSLRVYYAGLDDEARAALSERAVVRGRRRWAQLKASDPVLYDRKIEEFHEAGRRFRAKNPDFMRNLGKLHGKAQERCPTQPYVYTHKMLSHVVDVVKSGVTEQKSVLVKLNESNSFLAAVREANAPRPGMNCKIRFDRIDIQRLQDMIRYFGYAGWKDFLAKVPVYNHKVVKIDYLTEKQDVGTITVDGQERWHDYHTFALASGVFTCNSIMENFWFANNAEGRGSKVEVLPGGENVGEVMDLSWFSRKLARGLRIPPSYLGIGDDEGGGGVAYNDGKLGAAMIQEYRFNKYCLRMQSLLAPTFDYEFKRFLRANGIEIESSLFELRFCEPQNFTKYRQIELDSAQMNVYAQVSENKKLSERFKFKRWLNLTDDEILENEKLWAEENADKLKRVTGETPADTGMSDIGLSNVGIRGGGDLDMSEPTDQEEMEGGDEMGGDEMSPDQGGAPPDQGGGGGPF